MQIHIARIMSILIVVVAAVIAAQAQQPAASMITVDELKAKMARNEPVTIIERSLFRRIRQQHHDRERIDTFQVTKVEEPASLCSLERSTA